MKRCFFSLFISWMFIYLCGCYTSKYILTPEEAVSVNQDIYLKTTEKTFVYVQDDVVRQQQINKKGAEEIFLQHWVISGDSLTLYYNVIKYVKNEKKQFSTSALTDSSVISKNQIVSMYYKEFSVINLIGLLSFIILSVSLIIFGISNSGSFGVHL